MTKQPSAKVELAANEVEKAGKAPAKGTKAKAEKTTATIEIAVKVADEPKPSKAKKTPPKGEAVAHRVAEPDPSAPTAAPLTAAPSVANPSTPTNTTAVGAAKSKPTKSKGAAEVALTVVAPAVARPPRKEVKKPEPIAPVSAAPSSKYPKINADDEFEGIEKLSDPDFMGQQLEILRREMATYIAHSDMLRAEADHLAAEMEPGDVQFDDESGEGASASMEREKDLAMAAQKTLIAEDIERAIERLQKKVYGSCTNCYKAIPRVRLRAMPQATLCIECKNGGLSRRS